MYESKYRLCDDCRSLLEKEGCPLHSIGYPNTQAAVQSRTRLYGKDAKANGWQVERCYECFQYYIYNRRKAPLEPRTEPEPSKVVFSPSPRALTQLEPSDKAKEGLNLEVRAILGFDLPYQYSSLGDAVFAFKSAVQREKPTEKIVPILREILCREARGEVRA